jgi:hypothetical protein
MAEITVVTSILAGIKHAIDLAGFLRDSTLTSEQAEQKLKLADLISALADTRMQVVDIQELLSEKDKRIEELEEAFQSKDLLIKHNEAYYEKASSGHATGEPYCMHCWEADHKKYHLYHSHKDVNISICHVCKTEYTTRRSRVIE